MATHSLVIISRDQLLFEALRSESFYDHLLYTNTLLERKEACHS